MAKPWEATAREHVRAILTHALLGVTPQVVIRERVRCEGGVLSVVDGPRIDFASYRAVRVAALGKAAGGMAVQAEGWTRFAESVVISPDGGDLFGFEALRGGHPEPDEDSVKAGERLLALARATEPEDLLLLLISGGGSALAECPLVPLEDLRETTRLLLALGAPIEELNAVRKHLSALKGGRLAEACRGRVVALILSDVAGDVASLVASGPAAPDPSTFTDAVAALRRRGAWDRAPASVRDLLERGLRGDAPETPKPRSATFTRVTNVVLAGNARALDRAADAARSLGYDPVLLQEGLRGEAREAGEALGDLAREARRGLLRAKLPCAILAGGETTVIVRGRGKGGRNQEVALGAVERVSGERVVMATLGTDGVDGPTDAAGAIVDTFTLARARALGLEPREHLEENDAYAFFDALSDLVRTGPTGTNVRDLAVVLVGPD